MDERIRRAVGDEPAWVVGGALRDELLGREIVDVDVACAESRAGRPPLRAPGRRRGLPALGAPRCLAGRLPGRARRSTSRRCTATTIEEDLATRDFTVNALARPLEGGALVDPLGGEADLAETRRFARSARLSSRTTRCGSCARSASRTSSDSGSTRRPRSSCAACAGPRRGAGRRADPRRARAALARRLPPRGRARAARAARRLARRPRPRRPGGHAGLPAGRRLRRAAPGLPRLQRPAPARAHAPGRRAARRRLAARDPPLPTAHRALGRSPRSPSSARPTSTTQFAPRGPPTPPSRSFAGEDVLELGVEPGPRSAVCWSSSPRSERSARSRPATDALELVRASAPSAT